MNVLKMLALIAVLMVGGGAVSAQANEPGVVITLERTACFGACPIYSVSILEDGTVLYNGERFVDIEGEQTGQIEPELVAQMVEAFAEAGYFEWDAEYTNMTVSDLPYIITSVTRDGETHTIRRYAGDASAPVALPYLEQWIDLMANTGMWTGVPTDMSSANYSMNSPVATLQRDPCFGFCPVYNVAAFEDGTLVYVGVRHVDKLGVHVYQVEPDAVESVVHRAELSGYFNWQDAYDHMLITDQATVTTSIQTDDNSKRIVRYDGDPNAPIGLLRVEESIDQLLEMVLGE